MVVPNTSHGIREWETSICFHRLFVNTTHVDKDWIAKLSLIIVIGFFIVSPFLLSPLYIVIYSYKYMSPVLISDKSSRTFSRYMAYYQCTCWMHDIVGIEYYLKFEWIETLISSLKILSLYILNFEWVVHSSHVSSQY